MAKTSSRPPNGQVVRKNKPKNPEDKGKTLPELLLRMFEQGIIRHGENGEDIELVQVPESEGGIPTMKRVKKRKITAGGLQYAGYYKKETLLHFKSEAFEKKLQIWGFRAVLDSRVRCAQCKPSLLWTAWWAKGITHASLVEYMKASRERRLSDFEFGRYKRPALTALEAQRLSLQRNDKKASDPSSDSEELLLDQGSVNTILQQPAAVAPVQPSTTCACLQPGVQCSKCQNFDNENLHCYVGAIDDVYKFLEGDPDDEYTFDFSI